MVATGKLYVYVDVVAGSSLTLRRAPSTGAAAIGYLARGEELQMLAFDDDWACVRTKSGETGFASRSYLYFPGSSTGEQPVVEDEPKEEGKKFKEVKTDVVLCDRQGRAREDVELYKTYSTDSKVLTSIPASAEFSVMAYNQRWAYVRYNGKNGFVLLEKIRPA